MNETKKALPKGGVNSRVLLVWLLARLFVVCKNKTKGTEEMKKKTYLKNTPPIHACLPRSPLTDGRNIVAVQQNRQKWQCKPVCKLYVREAYGKRCRTYNKHYINARMKDGLTFEEALKEYQNL